MKPARALDVGVNISILAFIGARPSRFRDVKIGFRSHYRTAQDLAQRDHAVASVCWAGRYATLPLLAQTLL